MHYLPTQILIMKNKKRQLLISYLYVETKQRPYECNTCSNDKSTTFDKVVSIIMNFNLIQICK